MIECDTLSRVVRRLDLYPMSIVDYIDVENIDPKNEKNVKTRFYEETGKTFKNRFITKLITNTQNNEIFSSEIIVLVFRTVCVATFESCGSSSENFLQLPC